MIKNSKGFTLVEALVVITVIGFIGVILTDLLFRSFRSSNKTQIQGILQESGQSALNVMDQSIRFSRIVCVEPGDGTGSIIAVRTRDARIIRFMMTYQTVGANGYISQDSPVAPVYEPHLCDRASSGFASGITRQVFLTDQDSTPGVSVRAGGSFELSTGASKDTVIVRFTLGPGRNAGINYDTQSVDIPFDTSIVLR